MGIKWFFYRRMADQDIEGKCENCGSRLDLYLVVLSNSEIKIKVKKCEKYPACSEKDAMILWPQRDDIKRINDDDYLELFFKKSTQKKL
ncbi:MAG: hypothetical protein WC485_01890 [Opitutaceae bacterium]